MLPLPALALAASVFVPVAVSAAETALGPLTLAYDPAVWHVEQVPGGATLGCLADECAAGSIVDVTVVVGGADGCSRRAIYEASAADFPAGTRHAVNPHIVGNLVLLFGIASQGLLLDDDNAVRGCLVWDGTAIHFGTRASQGLQPDGHAGSVFALLTEGLRSPPGELLEMAIGDIVVPYRSDQWRAEQLPSGDWRLACLPPGCGADAIAHAWTHPAAEGCSSLEHEEHVMTQFTTAAGLEVSAAEIFPGCRNLIPPDVIACIVHGAHAHLFSYQRNGGCRSAPDGEVTAAALEALLSGAVPSIP